MFNFHKRHFPAITLHSVFPRERDESPPLPETRITFRRIFPLDNSIDPELSLSQSPTSGLQPLPSAPCGDDLPTTGYPNKPQMPSQGDFVLVLTSELTMRHTKEIQRMGLNGI